VGLFIAQAVFQSIGGNVSFLDDPSVCCVQAVIPQIRPEDICYG